MSLSDDMRDLEERVEELEAANQELQSDLDTAQEELQVAEDALEGYQKRSLAEIECRRCGRPFRGGGLTDYCTKDCELGNWPRKTA